MPPLLVTAAIIEHEGKYLLTRRRSDVPYPDFWEFPGGKLESGEDPKECVIREIHEELAIEINIAALFDVIFYRYPERTVLVIAYRCNWLKGDIEDLEVAEHRWVSARELENYNILPADISIVKRLIGEDGSADSAHL